MKLIVRRDSIYYSLFYLLMLSLYFGRFNLDLGFSLKPFMIIMVLITLFSLKYINFNKLFNFEINLVIFIIIHSMTALNFKYPSYSIRFIILYIIIFVFYFSTRSLLEKIDVYSIEKVISRTGFIAIVSSLIYYILGILASGMNYFGNKLNYYGLMIDRSTPRLTGTASSDPNIFVFYVTLYFFYTLSHLDTKLNKIGFLLVTSTIILTFSRGAYLALGFGLITAFLLSNGLKIKIKGIIVSSILITFLTFFGDYLKVNPIKFIIDRFSSFATDGGSGRLAIWANAIDTFNDNPILGIGINSVREYNFEYYNRGVYLHNSLLEVLVETGIVGSIIYALFLILLFINAIKLYMRNKKTLFILLTLLSMFIQMNSLSILYNEVFYILILLLYRYSIEFPESRLVRTKIKIEQ